MRKTQKPNTAQLMLFNLRWRLNMLEDALSGMMSLIEQIRQELKATEQKEQ